MKLYTELQVREAISKADVHYNIHPNDIENAINLLTPIELPSDDEIEKQTNGFMFEKNKEVFYNGAKWMKEQILGKEDKTFKQKSKWTEVDNMTRRLK